MAQGQGPNWHLAVQGLRARAQGPGTVSGGGRAQECGPGLKPKNHFFVKNPPTSWTAIMIRADLVDAICSLLTIVTVAARLAFATLDVSF